MQSVMTRVGIQDSHNTTGMTPRWEPGCILNEDNVRRGQGKIWKVRRWRRYII